MSSEAEAERLETHRFIGTVSGEHDQISPGDLPAVLLLERPKQPACLVEVGVVGPTVEGGEALGASAATAPTVPVVAVVRRPPVLRRRHHLNEVPLQGIEVKGLERISVLEIFAHRIGQG